MGCKIGCMRPIKIAILCYHSWNTETGFLRRDIEDLRNQGWIPLSLKELIAIKEGTTPRGNNFFHITNDDVSPEDEKFSDLLQQLNCPATFFVVSGQILHDREGFYKDLDGKGLISIEDHSLNHWKNFIGPKLIEFQSDFSKSTGLEPLRLQKGMPITEFASELAFPIFSIDSRINAFCVEWGKNLDWSQPQAFSQMADQLVAKGLAKRQGPFIYLKGVYESRSDYAKRVRQQVLAGRNKFEEIFERKPSVFCCPLFNTSGSLERVVHQLGYKLQFGGGQRYWGGHSEIVPRVPINNTSQRPLDLDKLCRVPLATRLSLGARRAGLGKIVDFVKDWTNK